LSLRLKLSGFLIESLEDGLILAEEPTSGIELLKSKTQSNGGRVVIPECNHYAMNYLENNGFSYCTSLNRMRLGEKYNWKPECVYNRGSGYCG